MYEEFEDGEVWDVRITADTTDFEEKLRNASSVGRRFTNSLVHAFEGLALKGKGLSEVFKGLALDLSKIVLKSAFRPLEQGFGNLIQGLVGGMLPFANGGVLQGGRVVPFASGGVISSPVAFPLVGGMTGLAGERGAEAILPLRRGADGRLGVAAQNSGGPSITINISTPDVESFRRSETQVAAMVARVAGRGQRNL